MANLFDGVKKITTPRGEVKKITRKSDGVVLFKSGYTNLVPLSTEADGKTIYNGGLGYKDNYRVRSGGAEASSSGASCTGFIPFVKGDKLYIYPSFTGGNVENAINFYNDSYEVLGQVTDSGAGYGICSGNANAATFKTTSVYGITLLDLSNNNISGVEQIRFVRITNNIGDSGVITSGSKMIITKNERVTDKEVLDEYNVIPLSTEADGKTIYNGGLGYKNGYRVRSGGAELESARCACTGFIPVKGGDVVRFSGWNITAAANENAITAANNNFATIGHTTQGMGSYGIFANEYSAYDLGSLAVEKTGVWKWVAPPAASGISYIRVSAYGNSNHGASMIVTVNKEI